MDTIMVKYPEKSLYLATAINSKGKYRVKKFNNYQIIVEENY
jgi:hypothetical protein